MPRSGRTWLSQGVNRMVMTMAARNHDQARMTGAPRMVPRRRPEDAPGWWFFAAIEGIPPVVASWERSTESRILSLTATTSSSLAATSCPSRPLQGRYGRANQPVALAVHRHHPLPPEVPIPQHRPAAGAAVASGVPRHRRPFRPREAVHRSRLRAHRGSGAVAADARLERTRREGSRGPRDLLFRSREGDVLHIGASAHRLLFRARVPGAPRTG